MRGGGERRERARQSPGRSPPACPSPAPALPPAALPLAARRLLVLVLSGGWLTFRMRFFSMLSTAKTCSPTAGSSISWRGAGVRPSGSLRSPPARSLASLARQLSSSLLPQRNSGKACPGRHGGGALLPVKERRGQRIGGAGPGVGGGGRGAGRAAGGGRPREGDLPPLRAIRRGWGGGNGWPAPWGLSRGQPAARFGA